MIRSYSNNNLIPKQCKTLKQLHQLHSQFITTGLFSLRPFHHNNTIVINNTLSQILHTFVNLIPTSSSVTPTTSLNYAQSLFNLIPNPKTFSYNNIIRAHVLLSSPLSALHFFVRMRRLSILPDFHTFPFSLKACTQLGFWALPISQALHSQAFKFGFASDSFVRNTLIAVYSFSRCINDACQAFDESSHRDVISYNVLIDGFIKSGEITLAREVFENMPVRDSVSWGTILAGCAQANQCEETTQLYDQMLASGVRPDNIALVSVLSACAQMGDLERGSKIHSYIRRNGIQLDSFLTTGLVDLYAKCGCIEVAREIFDSSKNKNLFTWNAILVGLAMHGSGWLSLLYFNRMIETGVQPDGVSLLGVLVGCSHAGLVREAHKIFEDMTSVYGVTQELKHYGCMIDLLGRAGLIDEATEIIKKMPMKGDIFVWGGLLGGCRIHGNIEIAKKAAKQVMELDPEDGGVYSAMANIYANSEQWDDVLKIRKSMNAAKNVKKNTAFSLIRLSGIAHEFISGDSLHHPQSDEIYLILNAMEKHQYQTY